MKEFIDKLISRLKEKNCEYKKLCDACDIDSELQYDLGRYYGVNDAISIVNQLAEEYKGGWIPCSEKKPRDGQKVITCDDRENLHVFRFDTERQCFIDDCYRSIRENHPQFYVPIAWMPLPEPYQKEGE